MKQIAAESLVIRLIEWGVDTIYGLPGDGINGLFEALRRHQDKITLVLVHHEEAAAFMACAHAKTTGKIGVCIATSGPGGVHLLNGLYDAKLDHQPVLAITGMQETGLLGTGYQQEVHLEKLYENVAEYDVMVTNPAASDDTRRPGNKARARTSDSQPYHLPERFAGRARGRRSVRPRRSRRASEDCAGLLRCAGTAARRATCKDSRTF